MIAHFSSAHVSEAPTNIQWTNHVSPYNIIHHSRVTLYHHPPIMCHLIPTCTNHVSPYIIIHQSRVILNHHPPIMCHLKPSSTNHVSPDFIIHKSRFTLYHHPPIIFQEFASMKRTMRRTFSLSTPPGRFSVAYLLTAAGWNLWGRWTAWRMETGNQKLWNYVEVSKVESNYSGSPPTNISHIIQSIHYQ